VRVAVLRARGLPVTDAMDHRQMPKTAQEHFFDVWLREEVVKEAVDFRMYGGDSFTVEIHSRVTGVSP
jgi:hypothetical protein